jgi:cytochrome c-type biogenesis protein CcsB
MHPLEPATFQAAFYLFFASFAAFLLYIAVKRDRAGKTALLLLGTATLSLTVNLVARGIEAHRVPFSNLYESLLIFMWGISLILIWCIISWRTYIAGAFILPIVLAMEVGALRVERSIQPLMPALQSNWMIFHVATAIIAYGAFTLSFAFAVIYLLRDYLEKRSPGSPILSIIPPLKKLDRMIFKIISFGFPFLVLLIITGSIWAERAWGRYWSWDPKETWSLITMLIYTGFFHTRYLMKWRGKTCAVYALIGFASVIFCYLGVNFLLSGLHSYGSR